MRFRPIFLLVVLLLAACGSAPASIESLPPGDATRGEQLFTETVGGAPACSICHTLNGETIVGPSLQGYREVAASRVEGVSAEEYTHISIVQPGAHVVSGFPNAMYAQYGQRLDSQQIADLVAYLLAL